MRALCDVAHEAELRKVLSELSQYFDRWKDPQIDSFELAERIHEFHSGPNREIYLRYANRPEPDFVLRRAIDEGLIQAESVSEQVMPYLEKIRHY